jgi:hypothetical protein
MQNPLLAMLVLASCIQQGVEDRPRPPRGKRVATVRALDVRTRQPREITLAMPAHLSPVDEEEVVDGEPLPQRQLPFFLNTLEVEPENFDRWLFGDDQSEEARKTHLGEVLEARIDAFERRHLLTDKQRAKLRTAGRGDIKRFFDEVQNRRRAFEKERQTYRTGRVALARLAPLSELYQEGPFGEGSLFAKMAQRIKDERKAGR